MNPVGFTFALHKDDSLSNRTSTGVLRAHLAKSHKIREDDNVAEDAEAKRQRTLFDSVAPKMSEAQKDAADEALLGLVLFANATFTLVRKKAFRKFCKSLNASYQPASVETLYGLLRGRKERLSAEVRFSLSPSPRPPTYFFADADAHRPA